MNEAAGRRASSPSHEALLFVGRGVVFGAGVAFALTLMGPVRETLRRTTVLAVQAGAALVGLSATVERDLAALHFVGSGTRTFGYEVVEECAAVAVLAVFGVMVLAYPRVSWARRATGVVAGSILLLLANWVRLLSLAWVGVHHSQAFRFAHVWLWQILSIIAVVGLWLGWRAWADPDRAPRPARRSLPLALVATTVAAGIALQVRTNFTAWYDARVEAALRTVQGVIDLLPYNVISLTQSPDEWVSAVRSTSLILAVALAMALATPTRRVPVRALLTAPVMVYAAHVAGAMLQRGAGWRVAWLQDFGVSTTVPLLVIEYGPTAFVPVYIWHTTRARSRPGTLPASSAEATAR